MSLEAKIELLTAAVVELTRVMQTRNIDPVSAPLDEIVPVKAEVPNAPQNSTPTSDTSQTSSPESKPATSVSYDDVKAITIAVSKVDKAKAVAGLARFGAKNAKELSESQWGNYVAYMTKVQAGEIDPESSHE